MKLPITNALYIAPELFKPVDKPVDGRADVYSLSRIVYYYSAFESLKIIFIF